ncbi:MAG: copper resistance protein B [Desulfobacteraceae bacterium]|jgi:copper resistance protein B|nr:copper resistance protein B [Desulfobacteraceae bacterium]
MEKTWLLCVLLAFSPAIGLALESPFAAPEDHGYPEDYHDVHTDPQAGEGIRKHAEDAQQGAQENFGVQFVHDNEIFAIFLADRLEYQTNEGDPNLLWDVQTWIGRDYNKLWFKSEGTYLFDTEKVEEAEVELFYSRNIASFWDFQIGLRHDFEPDPSRTFAAFGFQGLAPYWFEVDATAYISEDGDISANIEAEYDLLLSQRLILQPRFETNLAVQEVEELNIGSGINDIELGLRLRYHIRREFAPYIGVSWSRKLGNTADMAEADGENINVTSFVAGVRFWF